MKRDMELIREVVLAAECGPPYPTPPGWSDDAIAYHQMLAIEAGLLKGTHGEDMDSVSDIPSYVFVNGVTWEGHDFIDAIRDDKNWTKVKNYLTDAGKQLSIDTIRWAVTALFGVS